MNGFILTNPSFSVKEHLVKRKKSVFRATAAMLSIFLLFSLGSCVSNNRLAEGKFTPGTYAATVEGFGGPVTVKIIVDTKNITAVKAEGPSETQGIGSMALDELPPLMLKAQTSEVDSISGATYTSNAVKLAANQALTQAMGKGVAVLTMKDGEYQATAKGFNLLTPMAVSVSIAGNKITAITIGKNGETNGMPQVVQAKLVPRIIEAQSLAIDALTGATSTSNALIDAVRNCAVQAGATEAALYRKVSGQAKKNQEYTADVVIVGMGGSGMAAAMSAAEQGLKVIAIDKAAKWGGTAAVTSGPMGINVPSQVKAEIPNWQDPIAATKRVKAAGEKLVDDEALFKDWVEYTKVDGVQDAKTEIIKEIMDRSGEVIDWLGGYGFKFTPAVGFVGGKWAIFTSYVGSKALTEDFFAAAYKKFADELGGQYFLETEATKLLMKNGKAVGVLATSKDGGTVTIHAKAVVLATGGFGGSESLMKKYLGESWKLYGMAQNDGAGILMATEQGAATRNIDMPPMSHFVAPYSIITKFDNPMDNDIPYGMICSPEALAVDQSGARFINEENIAMNAYKVGSKYYTIFSKEQIDALRQKGFSATASGRYLSQGGVKANIPLSNIDQVMEEGVKRGFIYKSDSIKGLISAINNGRMTEKALLASIEGYGAGAKGSDPFGKPVQRFERLGAPNTSSEYYVAVTGAPYIYSVCAGLDVNAKMQVLKKGGKTLDGLYAVGTDSMGVLFTNKKGYVNYGGVAQGYAFTSGKIAGEEIAAALKK